MDGQEWYADKVIFLEHGFGHALSAVGVRPGNRKSETAFVI
jgi:hypothetical protein